MYRNRSYYSRRSDSSDTKFKVLVVLVVLVIIGSIIGTIATKTNDHTYVVTVTRVERENKDGGKYIISTILEDGTVKVFENTDTLFRGKFDSSDINATIIEDKKYEFTVIGYRVPFLSWYENILEAREVSE